MIKTIKLMALIVAIAVLAACTSTATRESTGQFLDSTAVTTKVKARLFDMLGTKALAIKVKTYKDEVQLSGFVNTNEIKRRAGIIADNTLGVARVRNDLIVKNEP